MIQKDRVPQMHASIKTVAFRGIDTIPVEVQVHVANGLPPIAIVGLADKAVAESRERGVFPWRAVAASRDRACVERVTWALSRHRT